jgi:hypothetical protein
MAHRKRVIWVVAAMAVVAVGSYAIGASKIGQEVAVPFHLQDGQEFQRPSPKSRCRFLVV